MSSAILYLAIVAIWACVLIPRWLRRDSAHGATAAFADAEAPEASPVATHADTAADGATATATDGGTVADDAPRPPAARPSAPMTGEESRRRMLAARRRLLGMLVILEAAAIALAFIGLAAMWVVVPPTIMLVGYLLLLREAAQADAEHAQWEAEAAAARAQAMARSRNGGRARAGQHTTPVEGMPLAGVAATATTAGTAASTAAELAARFAAAPVPADYEDSGRDFAPGLAGKYTTSNADSDRADEDHYSYEEPRLRAVGD